MKIRDDLVHKWLIWRRADGDKNGKRNIWRNHYTMQPFCLMTVSEYYMHVHLKRRRAKDNNLERLSRTFTRLHYNLYSTFGSACLSCSRFLITIQSP